MDTDRRVGIRPAIASESFSGQHRPGGVAPQRNGCSDLGWRVAGPLRCQARSMHIASFYHRCLHLLMKANTHTALARRDRYKPDAGPILVNCSFHDHESDAFNRPSVLMLATAVFVVYPNRKASPEVPLSLSSQFLLDDVDKSCVLWFCASIVETAQRRGAHPEPSGRGQFVEFPDYQRARPYAILSHTWNPKGEQTYQQLRKIQRRYGPDGSLWVAPNAVAVSSTAMPSSATIDITQRSFPAASRESEGGNLPAFWNDPRLSDKVRGACAIARANGYDLIWIDSCCIDKTSSAELSEAINSMYLWYNASAVCYVFLVDVPPGDSVEAMDSHFRASRWFKRGWTLQELLAPRNVQFLDSDWRLLGSKASLAQVVQECTRIDVEVLTHIRPLDRVSVARRMSWAANRETSRIEDRAYSLMGMFDIRMPTLYGEGQGAFRRLQEEILHRIPDQSLFAWTSGESIGVLPYVRHGSITFLADTISLSSVVRQDPERTGKPGVSLFASSPSEFGASHCISPLSPSSSVLSRSYPPFDYVQMPYGMRAQFLMIPADRLPSHRYYFLVLACQHVRRAEQLVIQLCYLGPRLHSGGPRRLSLPKLASARGGLLTMQASTFLATKVRVKTVYIPHYSSSGMPSLPGNPFASLESYPPRFWSGSATFSLSLAPRARAALQNQGYSVEIADRHDPGVWILLLSRSRNEQTLRIAFHAAPSDPPFLKVTAIVSDDGSGRSTHSLLAVLEPDPNHSHEFSAAMRFRRLVLRTATGALWDLEVWSESKKVLFRPAHHLLVVCLTAQPSGSSVSSPVRALKTLPVGLEPSSNVETGDSGIVSRSPRRGMLGGLFGEKRERRTAG